MIILNELDNYVVNCEQETHRVLGFNKHGYELDILVQVTFSSIFVEEFILVSVETVRLMFTLKQGCLISFGMITINKSVISLRGLSRASHNTSLQNMFNTKV